jgi:hypothetical protein
MIKTTGAREIAKVTARSTDALTIVRAQDNTSALAFDEDDKIELRANAAALEEIAAIGEDALSDTVSFLTGRLSRSQFTYVDADTITVGGGAYDVNGTWAEITTPITTVAHGLTGSFTPGFAYLYIDYSDIPSDGILLQATLDWLSTKPSWSDAKRGWYSGNDRCIFACYVDGSDEIYEFVHSGDLVQYGLFIEDLDGTLTTSYAAQALTIPDFGAMKAPVLFSGQYVDQGGALQYGAADASNPGAKTHEVLMIKTDDAARTEMNMVTVVTDASQQIQLCESGASNNTYIVNTMGFYLPQGM